MSPIDARTVVITDYDYGDVAIERAIIEGAGLQLTAAHCKTEDEVIEAARDADAIIAQYATVGAKAIAALTLCRVIARYGTGVDIVDVDAATERGILVTNVPSDWCENEVADHAMALLLASARKICAYDRATRGGTWRWQTGHPIHRLRGNWVGLLSFGAIAQAIATRAAGFGMRVIAHDPYVPEADIAARGAVPVSFDQLLEQSDYVVVQAPLTQETHHLIGEAELRRMKPTAFCEKAGSPAPAWTTSRKNRQSSASGSRTMPSSPFPTPSSHRTRRTTPKRRSTPSATSPRTKSSACSLASGRFLRSTPTRSAG